MHPVETRCKMGEQEDVWKIALHKEMITAMTEVGIEREQAIQKVGYYYKCCAPASLYKYYRDTPENIDAVKNNKMWYSAPCNFNDVFDCGISIDEKKVFNEALKLLSGNSRILPGSNAWKNLQLIIKKNMKELQAEFDSLKDTTGVSCLSESKDSLLMWAHYANNHRGFCVEYDLLEINRSLRFTAVPVIYSEEKTCFDFFDPQSIGKDTWKLFIQSLTSKSPEWRYEKEWRIIRDQGACGDKWNVGKKGALLDMIRPSSIILGCAVKPEFEKEVKDYCSSNEINLYKMEKDQLQYKLNKKAILEFNKED